MFTQEQIDAAWKLANEKGIRYFGAVGTNAKTLKSDKKTNYLTHIMYLAPATQSGKYNVCPMASKGCAEACLYTAGHGAIQSVKNARIKRTHFFFEHLEEFKVCVWDEIYKHRFKAFEQDKKPAVRLNGTSDIVWEKKWPELFEEFEDVAFYDYTKIWPRLMADYKLPKNYYLLLSRSESNEANVDKVLKSNPKANVTVVFDKLPKKWKGRRVIDGDQMDLRILDPKGVIVGLKAKGEARYDDSGFVVWAEPKKGMTDLTIKGKQLQLV
jgi:hypothetical protein